jgi:hypothetical protein
MRSGLISKPSTEVSVGGGGQLLGVDFAGAAGQRLRQRRGAGRGQIGAPGGELGDAAGMACCPTCSSAPGLLTPSSRLVGEMAGRRV